MECLLPLCVVTLQDTYFSGSGLLYNVQAHVVSPRDITCLIIPRDGRGLDFILGHLLYNFFNLPYPHPLEIGAVDAVAGCDDPPLGDEGAAAADPLA